MPQVHKTTQSGEHAQRFIEFVVMHAQNAAFFLGQMPNPQTGQPEVNLDMAKLFIDQLEMIQEKTRGNLSKDEQDTLANTLTNLRMAYVNASSADAARDSTGTPPQPDAAAPDSQPGQPAGPDPQSDARPPQPAENEQREPESKKKFSKSYGP